MSHPIARLLFWSPRILALAFAIFLAVFALDVFNQPHGFWSVAVAFGIHLVPTAIILAILAAAWRWEWPGALLFTLAAALYAYAFLPSHPGWVLVISLPLMVIAGLFFAGWIVRLRLRTTV